MPKTFETPFAPKEEPKSPEQIKEEQGLALAEEINKIKKRITEQGGTIEDYQRIIELTQRIKEIFEEKEGDYEAIAKTIVTNLEKALKQEADKGSVASGLAGVNTKDAEEFRRKHFGNEPNLMAKSYSTGLIVLDGVICRYGMGG